MLTFMLTCVTCTSLRHWVGGVGDVNVHVHLRHMHNAHLTLRHWVGGVVLCKGLNQKENYSDSHRWCRCDVATIKVRHTMQSLDQIQRPS